jgi:hypothetical protein
MNVKTEYAPTSPHLIYSLVHADRQDPLPDVVVLSGVFAQVESAREGDVRGKVGLDQVGVVDQLTLALFDGFAQVQVVVEENERFRQLSLLFQVFPYKKRTKEGVRGTLHLIEYLLRRKPCRPELYRCISTEPC